jgi:hypothetical protein
MPQAENVTGTIFSPTVDPAVNQYDVTPANPLNPTIGSPPPVFAQPAMPAEPKTVPAIDSAPLNTPPPAAPSPPKPTPKSDVSSAKPAMPATPSAADGDLMAIKQTALQSLTPLVDDLQQTPEDKFKTMMMLIQASDDSTLIKKAYGAANSIKDEKLRAQALLDVVNEINYFTQPKTENKKQ